MIEKSHQSGIQLSSGPPAILPRTFLFAYHLYSSGLLLHRLENKSMQKDFGYFPLQAGSEFACIFFSFFDSI